MNARRPDPTRLDVAALAGDAGELQGQWQSGALERLTQIQSAPQDWAGGYPNRQMGFLNQWDVLGGKSRHPQHWVWPRG
jgi:hypothetical protein